ncbi:ECF RNA polymerase sigma factor SigW [Stieleria maiorica]|uniref:ECF RNA polymerase sigma factor SigW n=1 Tax=Stieleria maiorica TaxID=2795974 RepID=A0A5B9MMK3_9BACT|nr:ECF RNA polymerase sigma factor SigW [Stieleria maiorica]
MISENTDSHVTRTSLLGRARERDRQAWSELVDLYGPLIAHWCGRCGLDRHAAADCTQEVFAALARSIGQFEPANTSGSFRAWLWTITSNKAKDRHRADARHIRADGGSTAFQTLNNVPDPHGVPEDEPTDDDQINGLTVRGLKQIRHEFADKTWRIFERAVIDDIPAATVAEEFDITPATVRQTRSRILRRLRQYLGE